MTEENTGQGQGPQGLSQADEEPGGLALGWCVEQTLSSFLN